MAQNQKTGREAEIFNLRVEKIQKLKDLGMEAYPDPATTKPTITLKELTDNFDTLEKEQKELKIVGRVLVKRSVGKLAFAKITDGTDSFQVALQVDILGKDKMKVFEKLFDAGDFVNFWGTLFVTAKGEKTLKVTDFKMAGKSLLPLPEKWHGLQDVEEKYRKRYLDLISDRSAYERFKTRAKIISEIRKILDKGEFLEIETPILQNQASGAMAQVFKTHHNDYDIDMVLRISLEAEHKMIMAGGYPAVYEIGKNFRNEGSDPTHIQEFTMIEWYKAYEGLDYNLKWTEKTLKHLAKNIVGKTKFKILDSEDKEVEIDFDTEWKKVEFKDLIREYAKIDPDTATRKELEEKAIELKLSPEDAKTISLGNLLDYIYKKTARKKIINPTFVMRYPGSVKPLAIQNSDKTAEVAQLVIAGAEMTNQYAELVDPIVQRKLLEDQLKAKEGGDEEAMDFNSDFLTAMEYGMPPMTGFGMGIDRLVAILTEQNNLRDTIFFPIMKPENDNSAIKEDKKDQFSEKIVTDEKVGDVNLGISLEKAEELIDKYITNPVTKLHSKESELIMRGVAKYFGENEEMWGIIGLLHDLDWDITKDNPSQHSLKTAEILKENGGTDFLIEAIKSHNYGYELSEELRNKKRETKIQFALAAAETLTGLIVASSLLLPSKTVKDVKLKSLKKRFKEKKFAANCNRDIILECERIGIPLDEFLEIGLVSLQEGADKLGI